MGRLSRLQWGLVIGAIALVAILYSLKITTPNTKKANAAQGQTEVKADNLDIAKLKTQALQSIPVDAKAKVEKLENSLAEAKENEQQAIQAELAEAYFAYKQFALAGVLFEQEAQATKLANSYLRAGNAFRDAYRNSNDSNLTPLLVQKAQSNYQEVLRQEPNNLDAKTGLGTCYVDASENPMQGIQLLLEVVKAEPENVNANLNLGMFSMRSGQYDKAIVRFETVVKKLPSAENYAMLAEAYEQSGNKSQAIAALKKAKEFVIDPQILAGIDAYIKNLEN